MITVSVETKTATLSNCMKVSPNQECRRNAEDPVDPLSMSVVFFQAAAVVRLSKLAAFKELQTYINLNRADFFEWLESGKPERSVPSCWDSKMSLSKLNC